MENIRLIRIFSSFPSDVSEEARKLDSVADRINRTSGLDHGIRFEIIRWDRDTIAAVGADIQEVINTQLDGRFEIVIATFWTRAGTPTPRAESGSIEEVKAAVKANKESGGAPLVMVYLKSAAVDIDRIDAKQLAVLQEFKSWLQENGVLYKTYRDTAEFENLLLVELSSTMRSIANNKVLNSTKDELVDVAALDTPTNLDDDLGYLDYLDIQDQAFDRLSELMAEQTESLTKMTEKTNINRVELDGLNADGMNNSSLRRVLKRGAEIWNSYSDEAEKRISMLERAAEDGFSAMANAIALIPSNNEESANSFRHSVQNLIDTIKETAKAIGQMKLAIEGFPRLTVESNRAKKRLAKVLQMNLDHFERALRLADTVLEAMPQQKMG